VDHYQPLCVDKSGTSTKVSLDVLTAYLDSEEFEYTLTDG